MYDFANLVGDLDYTCIIDRHFDDYVVSDGRTTINKSLIQALLGMC